MRLAALALGVVALLVVGVVRAAPAAAGGGYQPPVAAAISDPFRPPAQAYGPGNRGLDYATAQGFLLNGLKRRHGRLPPVDSQEPARIRSSPATAPALLPDPPTRGSLAVARRPAQQQPALRPTAVGPNPVQVSPFQIADRVPPQGGQ